MGSNYLLYSGGFFFSSVKKKKINKDIQICRDFFFLVGLGWCWGGGGWWGLRCPLLAYVLVEST